MVDAARESPPCLPTPSPATSTPLIPVLAALLALLAIVAPAGAQQRSIPITGDRLSGTVLPVEPIDGDIMIEALHGWVWTVDDTQRLVLEGDVRVHVGGFTFTSDEAIVWLNRLPSARGLINQIALYFDRVNNPTRRAGIGVGGRDLLITGSAIGGVSLQVSLLERRAAPRSAFLRRGETRLREHRRRVEGDPPPDLTVRPQVDRPPRPDEFTPVPGGTVDPRDAALPTRIELPAEEERPWLGDPTSVIRFSYGALELAPGVEENVITITDSVVVEYFSLDAGQDIAQLTLSADRAVIFTDPGPLEEMAQWQLEVSRVRGIYLEGNVSATANDGEYAVRAPRVYYDFTTDQAIMLDAVLRTYDRDLNVPIYARAAEMRQIARSQWTANEVRVSTSEFYVGHLALGADRVTITRPPAGGAAREDAGPESRRTRFDARHITLRAQNLPFFYWPSFVGTVRDIPLRRIDVGTRDNDGLRVETTWDLFTLMGGDRPEGVDAALRVDGFTKRGAALGLTLDYDVALGFGEIDLYGLHDDGRDRTSSGRDVEQDNAFRGVALLEHQTALGRDWLLQAQASYISDETFITAWREDDFEERREYETSLYLKNQTDQAAFTLLVKDELNDFISNSYLLASTQYQVDKIPEIAHRRYGAPLFNSLTYSGETRFDRMRMVFEESTPEELGVRGRAFGIPNNVPVPTKLRDEGLVTKWVSRFDSRHEVSRTTQWGVFKVTPFAVARLTAWDDEFEEFAPEEDDKVRAYGSVGVRVNTQFQRVDNTVESELFDLHRMRHIVEPSVTLWYAHSDVSEDDLPIYDLDVESLATGAAVRFGVRNTWQTQRGGPGRWRSVDVLTIDTDLVLSSGDTNTESPAPQFFDYRPEYSQFGDHVRGRMVWLLSDALAIAGEGTVDIEESRVARGSIGAELRHSPLLTTFVEFRYLEASDNELLGLGWNYRLTPKYRVSINPQWDFREDDFRAINVRVTRSFPDFDLIVRVRHDQIKDDTSLGASLELAQF